MLGAVHGGGGQYVCRHIGWHRLDSFTKAKLENGWQLAASKTYARPGCAKDSSGVVHLRGVAYNGLPDATAFVLPKGLRPSHYLQLLVVTTGGTPGSNAIQKDGEVLPSTGNVSASTTFDGISFAACE